MSVGDTNVCCTLGVGDDHDAAYLSIGQHPLKLEKIPAANLQKKPTWQSAVDTEHLSWLCNIGSGYDKALCVTYEGGVSEPHDKHGEVSGNVWLARYDNGEQVECIG